MTSKRDDRYEYLIDLENLNESFGVWNLRSFRDRNSALSYAESLAKNNPDMSISVTLVFLGAKKNILRTS